jgi:uncharacterized protein
VSRWRRALAREPDRTPELPLRASPSSNGEFLPAVPTARESAIDKAILARVADAAQRSGMDRRRFLQSSAGVAASLSVFNSACSSGGDTADSTTSTTRRRSTTSSTSPAGTFEVPEPEDVVACAQELSGTEFIFDVHTHHVVPDGPWRENAQRIASMIRRLVPQGCNEADPYRCVDRTAYLHDLFLASDTTIALLSDVPNSGPHDAPVPWADKRETRQLANALASPGADRVVLHDVIAPNYGALPERLAEMEQTAATGDVAAFKVYTAWGPGGQGYELDDPAIGIPVVEKAREMGVRIMCGHKGLPLLEFDRDHNGPRDMVALSRQFPDMDFVIYHAAYERETREGPYDPSPGRAGVDSLVRALDEYGVGPNENVYAELGTTWREVLSRPDEAGHVVGKLLKHLGEDRLLWGTDAVWFGSPQPQIMAFRAFQISAEHQERFGYPALTDEVKAKVFGLNAAALFGIDPEATRCVLDADGLSRARDEHVGLVFDGAIPEPWQSRGPLSRREVLAWVNRLTEPWTP